MFNLVVKKSNLGHPEYMIEDYVHPGYTIEDCVIAEDCVMTTKTGIGEYLRAKERMQQLSLFQRKMVVTIHDLGELATNTEIARRSFSTHATVSSILSVLKKKGIVDSISFGRNSYWIIADFQICEMLDVQKQPRNNL